VGFNAVAVECRVGHGIGALVSTQCTGVH
jgi:hypothetical protein